MEGTPTGDWNQEKVFDKFAFFVLNYGILMVDFRFTLHRKFENFRVHFLGLKHRQMSAD